jgi:kynurenine formamidase
MVHRHGTIPEVGADLIATAGSRRTVTRRDRGPRLGCRSSFSEFLVEKRNVNGSGVEAIGTDAGQAYAFEPGFPAHHLMHGAKKLGLASLTNLDQLPAAGAVLITAPLKIENGSGSPIRALALVAG